MSAISRPHAVILPTLDAQWMRLWVEKTQDLVLLLDEHDCITGGLQDGAFNEADVHHWIGQPLVDVVSADTRAKIAPLLANDTASPGADDRWRHINYLGLDGSALPVLARYMRLPDLDGPTRMVICRDLRPTQDLNQRHMLAYREIEQTVLDLREALHQKDLEMSQMRACTLDVQALVHQIRQAGLDPVIRHTTRMVQRQCMQALLDLAQGDPEQAARLAGLDPQSWADRTRGSGL